MQLRHKVLIPQAAVNYEIDSECEAQELNIEGHFGMLIQETPESKSTALDILLHCMV